MPSEESRKNSSRAGIAAQSVRAVHGFGIEGIRLCHSLKAVAVNFGLDYAVYRNILCIDRRGKPYIRGNIAVIALKHYPVGILAAGNSPQLIPVAHGSLISCIGKLLFKIRENSAALPLFVNG